ncbi:DNA replication complex GINS protein PSF3 isoform X2 [Dendroctonus ponderosae]|uniref:DNA replication complex GINS protein PSF3 isoform X2 n=1 Tax=Dendroctonus ponderosae TaxID=77166 RepID=UPI002035F402|nr:DNA replication complex GINS protein PSF3 isoform X2 [Dendroctonus ponderosae]
MYFTKLCFIITCKTANPLMTRIPSLNCKLNPSAEDKDVKAGTELELPVWLVASDCSIGRQPIFAPELPKIYKEAYREILKADATAVDLHKFNVYFYELGAYVKQFDRKDDVHAILLHTFTTRFRLIMDLAHNSESNPTVEQKLDMLERRIYRVGHSARVKLNSWLLESGVQLQAANMVTNHRKRKRVDDDLFN